MRAEGEHSHKAGKAQMGRRVVLLAFVTGVLSFGWATGAAQGAQGKRVVGSCRRAVLQGDVKAGSGFEAPFARGLQFGLVPLASGWVVRVFRPGEPGGAHDLAELATLPYQSVSPLLISTDWSFRAQDAIGWSPRRFRYAVSPGAARVLRSDYDGVLRGNAKSSVSAAQVATEQPEGLLTIEDARLVPGVADQARMAAAVSTHFQAIPHTIDPGNGGSPLGRLEELRFRVLLELPSGLQTAPGVSVESFPCLLRPTTRRRLASEHLHPNVYFPGG